jgi:hypothetical protein
MWSAALAVLMVGVAADDGLLTMEVRGHFRGVEGLPAQQLVAEGAVLRSGDGVQIRLLTSRDAYVYVIAHGSSGRAVLVQPYSRDHDDAFQQGGEMRIIPGPDGFLYLDDRVGNEALYAVASLAPYPDLDGLLASLESRGRQGRAAVEDLLSGFAHHRSLAFRHEPPPTAAVPGGAQAASREEEGVLSGVGSRIRALEQQSGRLGPAAPPGPLVPRSGTSPATDPATGSDSAP